MKKMILLLCLFLVCGCKEKLNIQTTNMGYTSQYIGQISRKEYNIYNFSYCYLPNHEEEQLCSSLAKGDEQKVFHIDYDNLKVEETKIDDRNSFDTLFYQNENMKVYETIQIFDNYFKVIISLETTSRKSIYESNNFDGFDLYVENDIPYLATLEEDKYIIHKITTDGLKETKQAPFTLNEYELQDFNTLGTTYQLYRGQKDLLLVIDDEEYHINKSEVDVFKDLIFLWDDSILDEPTTTKIIHRNTKEEIELEDPIGIESVHENYFIGYHKVDESSIYLIGLYQDNTLTLIETPFTRSEDPFSSILSHHTILIPINDTQIVVSRFEESEDTYNYYLMTIEGLHE